MPDYTVSTDIDTLLKSADNAAARSNLGLSNAALTTAANSFSQTQTFAGTGSTSRIAATQSTGSGNAVTIDTSATATGIPLVVTANNTASSSPAVRITNLGLGNSLLVEDSANPDSTPFAVSASGRVGVGVAPDATAAITVDAGGIKFSDNSTQTTAGLTGTVQEANGGTGETSYTNGQLLIGNSAGGLTKATLTAGSNVTVTNGDGSVSIDIGAGAYWEFFEHFMSTTLSGNLALAVTGGTNTLVNSGFGIVAMSTGTSAVANQQSRLNQAATNAVTNGTAAARAIFRFAQGGVTWFDATLTGALRCGWGDSTTGESANGIYFRVQDGQGIDFVTRASNIETLTSTGVSFANGVFRNMEILINSAGNQVTAKIDGTTVATHTTNVPTARLIFFSHINRTSTTGTAVNANLDLVYSRITPNTPFFS